MALFGFDTVVDEEIANTKQKLKENDLRKENRRIRRERKVR